MRKWLKKVRIFLRVREVKIKSLPIVTTKIDFWSNSKANKLNHWFINYKDNHQLLTKSTIEKNSLL